jgi:hypothetical protein
MPTLDAPMRPGAPLPPRTSRLAILALGLNIPCFLPPFTLAAVILGIVAYVRVRRRNDLGGAALALAAILLGSVLTVILGSFWYGFARVTVRGPIDAIHAAERGDGEALRSLFVGDAAELSDAEIALFARTLGDRYGPLQGGRIQRILGDPPRHNQVWSVPFDLAFERGAREAIAGITVVDPVTGRSTFALESITVVDPDLGDVRFPRRSRTLPGP